VSEYKIGDQVTVGGITFTKHSDNPFGDDADAFIVDHGCCALDEGHEGPCAWICPECHGGQRCRECGDRSRDDFGGCSECGGGGGCGYCYEGMVVDE
jgi:hypothetical protein